MTSTSESSFPITTLTYSLSPAKDMPRGYDAILHMQGAVRTADYHFRVKVARRGVDPLTVATRIEWGEGTCRFVIEAPASEEALSIAWDEAVLLIGLRADHC
jgi:hypothetical protein